MQINYPSIKTLVSRLNIERETAKLIRSIMAETSKQALIDNCNDKDLLKGFYNYPSSNEMKMMLIDKQLESYGTEAFQDKKGYCLEYCNMGDTYIATICFYRGRF